MNPELRSKHEEEKEVPYLKKNEKMIKNITENMTGNDNTTLYNMYNGRNTND